MEKQQNRELIFTVNLHDGVSVRSIDVHEATTFQANEGNVAAVWCVLKCIVNGLEITGQGDSREEAIYELEKALPKGSYMRICHQCRYGLYHPFQGAEMSCLKYAGAIADAINERGKSADADLSVFGQIPTGDFFWCKDFQRPLTVHGLLGSVCRC